MSALIFNDVFSDNKIMAADPVRNAIGTGDDQGRQGPALPVNEVPRNVHGSQFGELLRSHSRFQGWLQDELFVL